MKYQFQIDSRPAGPVRKLWADAAEDAIGAGYGVWAGTTRTACKLDDQASIARVEAAALSEKSEKEAPHGRE